MCYAYTGDQDVASDLVQDTFLKVWTHIDDFKNKSSINTWIYRIAVNTCIAYIKIGKRLNTEKIDDSISDTIADTDKTTDYKINLLYQCISLLQESDRLIISMVLDEVTYPEIAEIAGISEGNLRVKIHRIKLQLTELFKKHERV